MNRSLIIQKYFIKSFFGLLILTYFCLSNSEEMTEILSPMQQFQLDFLYQEINQFPDLFINDWTTSSSVQLIVESAELAIQNSSEQTKPIMKQRVIELFRQIGISIEFTPQDLIMKVDSTQKSIHFRVHDKKRHIRLKKRHHPQQQKLRKEHELQKIKGARRTLRRVKKKLADQQIAAQEAELAEIRYNAFLKNKDRQRIDQPHETVDSIEFWQNRLRKEHLNAEKMQPKDSLDRYKITDTTHGQI